MTNILALGVELDLWVYIVVGVLAIAAFVGGGIVTYKDKKKKAAKVAAKNSAQR